MQISRATALFVIFAAGGAAQTPEVQRLFQTRCVGCHGSAQQMSGLRLDSKDAALAGGYSGKVIVPGDSGKSSLMDRVQGKPGIVAMPPGKTRLKPEEIAALKSWIDAGAPWEAGPESTAAAGARKSNHWAFQPIGNPAPPDVRIPAVDAFVQARLQREGLSHSAPADRRTLLRRVTLDLTGLLPTAAEMEAFLADRRPEAFAQAVDRLLASPHFGERWARPWLDRARYADSDGYEKDWVRPWAWRYRQWVIDAFNSGMPFDRFTVEQVAGDLMPDGGMEAKIAAGFHRNTLTNREGGIDNNQFLFEAAIDRTSTVSSAWLGLTAGCAQCHDHKFDPISQKEFYQLFAFFEPMVESDIRAPLAGEMERWTKVEPEYRRQREALLAAYDVPRLQADWEKRMLEAEAHPGRETDWDLAWDCLLKLMEGSENGPRIMHVPEAQRTRPDRDALTDHFARNYHFAVGQKRYKELKIDELDRKLGELKAEYPQPSEAMSVTEPAGPQKTFLRVRGDYRTQGIPVERNTLGVLPALQAKGEATRLDLARWMVSPENPLTARVAVNWIWQELFGRGLVSTADDFGTRGEKPSHPELLDYLAHRFRQDWDVKGLIRTIVLSGTYQQSSHSRPELETKDPLNALLARQTRLRLPAELIRDTALQAGGLLNPEVGGKSIRPPQPSGVAALGYGKKDDAWKVSDGAEQYRRGLYIHFQRATPYPLLMNFDAPKGAVTQCRRERSTTSLQALNLLNDPVFLEAAAGLARRAMAATANPQERLNKLFVLALGRPPEAAEAEKFQQARSGLQSIYEKDAAAAAQVSGIAGGGHEAANAAVWINLASVLLNTDEFITRE